MNAREKERMLFGKLMGAVRRALEEASPLDADDLSKGIIIPEENYDDLRMHLAHIAVELQL